MTPLPSPGVVRRGSVEGLLRSSALRLEREKSNQTLANSEAEEEKEELEIMRHFEAVDKKVFNRGDSHSFRKRDKGDRRMARFLSEDETDDPSKTYKVSFLGASSVGKGGLHLIFSLLLELLSPLKYHRPERFVTEMSWSLRYRRR